jgi:hypothetical protein
MWLDLEGPGPAPLLHMGMTGYIAARDGGSGKIDVVSYVRCVCDATGMGTLKRPCVRAQSPCAVALLDGTLLDFISLLASPPSIVLT